MYECVRVIEYTEAPMLPRAQEYHTTIAGKGNQSCKQDDNLSTLLIVEYDVTSSHYLRMMLCSKACLPRLHITCEILWEIAALLKPADILIMDWGYYRLNIFGWSLCGLVSYLDSLCRVTDRFMSLCIWALIGYMTLDMTLTHTWSTQASIACVDQVWVCVISRLIVQRYSVSELYLVWIKCGWVSYLD